MNSAIRADILIVGRIPRCFTVVGMPLAGALGSAVVAVVVFPLAASAFHNAPSTTIGPAGPKKAVSTHGMKLTFNPDRGVAGTTFVGTATRFKSGEYVTIYGLSEAGKWTQHNGDTADGSGKLKMWIETHTSNKRKRKICAQGERTKRVACGTIIVDPGGTDPTTGGGGGGGGGGDDFTPPTTGPGFVPPTTGPGFVPPTTGPGFVPPGSG